MLKVFLGKFTYKEIITIWNDHVANFTTEGVRHCFLSGYSKILEYINFGVSGQLSSSIPNDFIPQTQ